MILRFKDVITHGRDTKLPGEDGEGAKTDLGTSASPKVKPFEEDSKDTLTCGWGNKPNPEKDLTLVHEQT